MFIKRLFISLYPVKFRCLSQYFEGGGVTPPLVSTMNLVYFILNCYNVLPITYSIKSTWMYLSIFCNVTNFTMTLWNIMFVWISLDCNRFMRGLTTSTEMSASHLRKLLVWRVPGPVRVAPRQPSVCRQCPGLRAVRHRPGNLASDIFFSSPRQDTTDVTLLVISSF